MTIYKYPQLVDETSLNFIIEMYKDNPDYFDNSPYPQKIIDMFKGSGMERDFDTHTDVDKKILTGADTETELNDLYSKMKAYWVQVKDSDKSADKNTYFRVSTTLMEKLVELQERMSNVNKFNTFMNEVLAIMDQVCDADQRNEIMERLQQFKTGDKK